MRPIFIVRSVVLLALTGAVAACVATTQMTMSQSNLPVAQKKPLTVAVVVPAATQGFSVANSRETDCWGAGDVNASYGGMFVDTLKDRLPRVFETVAFVPAGDGGESDAILEFSLTGLSFRNGCLVSPTAYFAAEGALRALKPDGSEIWRSPRTKSETTFGGMADTRNINVDLANQMGKLVDEWSVELLNMAADKYAYNAAAPTRAVAAADPKFPRTPIAVSFRAAAPRPDDVAVVIGNANYGKFGADIPDVWPAYADAASFRRYAETALGVRPGNVIDLRDATSAQLVQVFGSESNPRGKLHDWVKPGVSRVTVYYAGHGAPDTGGGAFLVPVDADAARVELSGYRLATLYRNLGRLPAAAITVVLEACFSGASQAGTVIANASPVYRRAEIVAAPANLTVYAAGAADQIASWEEDKSHGLFTKYFLSGMAGAADAAPYGNGDGKVTRDELARYLDGTLTYYARRYYGRDQKAQITAATAGR